MATSEKDIFQEEAPPTIVDFDLLEAAKENVQPLASGRRVTALSALLSTPHAERDAKLASTKNRLRINVEIALNGDDDDDDPLEAYCRLVYWTVENYPQGHSTESGLLELLEEATRVLKDHRGGKCRGELKYLKLWMLYASYVERPTIIYRFLFANDIGTSLAPLYEEYATLLERDGRRAEADEAYTLGIARQATPLDHLKVRHREFQKRMMSTVPATPAVPPPPAASSLTTTSATRRVVLGTSSTSTSAVVPPAPLPRARGSSSGSGRPTTTSNIPVQVFVDPTGELGVSPSLATPNAYPELGSRHSRVRENIPEVGTMGGTTIRQPGRAKRVGSVSGSRAVSGSGNPSTSGSAAPRIVPFRDPGPEAMGPPSVPTVVAAATAPKKKKMQIFMDPPVTPAKSSLPAGEPVQPTPKFTPFRDEPEPSTSTVSTSTATSATLSLIMASAPESIMKVKKVATTLAPLTEAEALRKDPLKNYGGSEAALNLED